MEEVIAWASLHDISWQREIYPDSPFPMLSFRGKNGDEIWLHLIELHVWESEEGILQEEFFKQTAVSLRMTHPKFVNLWEDQWNQKGVQVKERLLTLLGYNATLAGRLTNAQKIERSTANDFIDKWHVNGSVNSVSQFGLYLPKRRFGYLPDSFQPDDDDEAMLVAVATFGRVRKMSFIKEGYLSGELVRFVSIGGLNIVGGLSKLLSAFEKEHPVDDIMTYADLDWSNGNNYAKVGFVRINDKPPFVFYINQLDMQRVGRVEPSVQHHYIKGINAGSRKWKKYNSK